MSMSFKKLVATGVEETKLLKAVGIDYRHDFPAWPDVAAHIPLAYIEGGEWEIREVIR